MTLSEEEKKRIEEEEAYRQKVREEQTYRSQLNEDKEPKKKSIGCLGTIFILILIFGLLPILIITVINPRKQLEKAKQQSTENNTSVGITTKPEDYDAKRKKHIDVSRKTIMDIFKGKGYVFKNDKPVNELESYLGTKGKGTIQLIGTEDNLNSISFLAEMGSDPDGTVGKSTLAQTEMILMAATVDKECSDWLMGEIHKMAENLYDMYTNEETACGRKLGIIYLPGHSTSFGIDPI